MKVLRASAKDRYGFTLIEVLVGLAILAAISIAMFTAFFVVTDVQRQSSQEATAAALTQGYLEEIREEARNDFDSLENTYGSDSMLPVPDFPGFNYNQRVIKINNNLKKAQAKVSWDYGNGTDQVLLTTLISRPASYLPGNIDGYIYEVSTAPPRVIGGATVTATWQGSGTRPSFTAITDTTGFYTFEYFGNFQLDPGQWRVSASHASYYDSDTTGASVTCTVNPGLPTQNVNLYLTPLPAPGTIQCTVTDHSSGLPITDMVVVLCQGGQKVFDQGLYTDASGNCSFVDLDPGDYTVRTGLSTYTNGYTYFFGETDPYPNKPYPPEGWSSARTGWPTTVPYNGPPDTINVASGGTTNVSIALDPIPTGVVTGIVYKDDDRNGVQDGVLQNASVKIYWRNWKYIKEVKTDGNGRYATSVPIPYFVYRDIWADRHIMQASASGYDSAYPHPGLSGAGLVGGSGNSRVNLQHGIVNGDISFLLPKKQTAPPKVGSVEGYVRDVDTGSLLNGVTVTIGGKTDITGTKGNGYYLIENIGVGNQRVAGRKTGYYYYDSWDTEGRYVVVVEGVTKRFDFNMDDIGYGNIKGRVTSSATGQGIAGANLTLTVYDGAPSGSPAAATTGPDGSYDFSAAGSSSYPVVETRGPGKLHMLSASAEGYLPKARTDVVVTDGNDTVIDFVLSVDDSGI